jgi:hypothetical protein
MKQGILSQLFHVLCFMIHDFLLTSQKNVSQLLVLGTLFIYYKEKIRIINI